MSMTTRIANNKLIVEIDLKPQPFQPSASGKTLIVASTNGNLQTAVQVEGKPLTVSVNAYIKK